MGKRYRSFLFVPASKPDLVLKRHIHDADAVIIDLEDGVAPDDKNSARSDLPFMTDKLHQTDVAVFVRINPLESGGKKDIDALAGLNVESVLLPKTEIPGQVAALENYCRRHDDLIDLQIYPMIETPLGMFNARDIADANKSVRGLVFGSEDFATSAGIRTTIQALSQPAQIVALAAAAYSLPAYGLPGSLANYIDIGLFKSTAETARILGFSGALCVHPDQVQIANNVFKPTADEIDWAVQIIEQAATSGGAVGSRFGMIDAPVLARAKAILGM